MLLILNSQYQYQYQYQQQQEQIPYITVSDDILSYNYTNGLINGILLILSLLSMFYILFWSIGYRVHVTQVDLFEDDTHEE
jgi:hypothetical protein